MEIKEKVQKEVKRIQEIIDTLTKEEQNQILRGERPIRINYKDFRLLNRTFNQNIKKYLKGKVKE
jgi:Rad3-related DNA helicase